MSFSSAFLSKANSKLVYSILNKTIDEQANKQLVNYPELNIGDRLLGVMHKFDKKQNPQELNAYRTMEDKLTFMNKKVLSVCIPGFVSLVNQAEQTIQQGDNSRNDPVDSVDSVDSGDSNHEIDITRQYEALEQERKEETSSLNNPAQNNEVIDFENKQDEFKERDKMFQERLERIQSSREQNIQNNLENPSTNIRDLGSITSGSITQNRNSLDIEIQNGRPALHEIDTKQLFRNSDQIQERDNQSRMEVHRADIGNPRLIPKLSEDIEKKIVDELIIIHASDRNWAGTWTKDSEGNDILSESPNPDRYRFPIKFSPSSTETNMASIQKSFKNITSIEIVDVMLSAHDNPCFEEFLVDEETEKPNKKKSDSKSTADGKDHTNSNEATETSDDTELGEENDTNTRNSDQENNNSDSDYEEIEVLVDEDGNEISVESEPGELEDDEYLEEDGLEEAMIFGDPDHGDEAEKKKKWMISFGESISVFQLYRFPYLLLDVQEFTGQLSSTNRFHRSAMTRLVVSRQFAPRGSEPLRGYIYLRSLVGPSMSSLLFTPTPLPSLDMLTFSLLLPTGQRYGEEHKWNRDPLVIRSIKCIPKGVSGVIEIDVSTPFFSSIYAPGDHIMIKSLEFVKDSETGGLEIVKDTDSFQEEIRSFLTRPEGNTIIDTERTLQDKKIPKPFRNKITVALPVKMDRFCRCQSIIQEEVEWRMKGHLLNGSIQPVYTVKISYNENEFTTEQLSLTGK